MLAAVSNATSYATGFITSSVQNGGIPAPEGSPSVYQKALAKFQAAAFEQERQALKSEISKLTDGLKKEFQSNRSDGDYKNYKKEISTYFTPGST